MVALTSTKDMENRKRSNIYAGKIERLTCNRENVDDRRKRSADILRTEQHSN